MGTCCARRRSIELRRGLLVLGVLAWAVPAGAQDRVVTVHGVAYDSLRGQPIKDAVVLVLGATRSATTDARGRFHLDSVAPGIRTITLQHASLDSVGLPGLSRRTIISDSGSDVLLAVPSFATLWRAACGTKPPADTGFVYGTIRDVVSGERIPDATVVLSWVITTVDKKGGARQRRVIGETRTNAQGSYAVCGVPAAMWVRVEARAGDVTGGIDLPPGELRMQRRDLLLGNPADSTSRGTISGILTDGEGFGYSEARIVLDDSAETRSDGDGRFAFPNVRAGTRKLEIFSIGMMPIVTSVDVFPRDSAAVAFQLRRVTTLDVVRVMAPSNRARRLAEGIEERRKSGFGYTMDMTELAAHADFATVLADMPGTRLEYRDGGFNAYVADGRGGQCIPEVWIDGHHMAMATLAMIRPKDVTAIELYSRAATVPLQYRMIERRMLCGAILVWTNWAFGK
jgi:hypothetical protein